VDSILTSVKKTLNLDEDYTFFDPELILHINSVFSTLTQLGLGPTIGFSIEDKTAVWDDFLDGDPRYSFVKSYMYLKVRLLFDPPTTGYVMDAYQKQIQEYEWRINVVREGDAWIPGTPSPLPGEGELILDGGGP
jgi:hypothetical protein